MFLIQCSSLDVAVLISLFSSLEFFLSKKFCLEVFLSLGLWYSRFTSYLWHLSISLNHTSSPRNILSRGLLLRVQACA